MAFPFVTHSPTYLGSVCVTRINFCFQTRIIMASLCIRRPLATLRFTMKNGPRQRLRALRANPESSRVRHVTWRSGSGTREELCHVARSRPQIGSEWLVASAAVHMLVNQIFTESRGIFTVLANFSPLPKLERSKKKRKTKRENRTQTAFREPAWITQVKRQRLTDMGPG